MKNNYIIIPQSKINMIVQIKDALGEDCDPYLEILIKHFLQDDAARFRSPNVQSDIADLIEKHDIDVR